MLTILSIESNGLSLPQQWLPGDSDHIRTLRDLLQFSGIRPQKYPTLSLKCATL